MSGRYKVLEELGAGGAGSVCKAYDTQLDRYVALKRLLTKEEEERQDTQSSGLRQEAASLATLQHPNIVTIYDLGSDDSGLFIVMELLEGETLADWLRAGTFNLPDFYELATQTLEGALSAHGQSILHRDLKPENMKVKRLPGGRLQVKIVDFGLARLSYGAKKQTEDQRGHVLGSIFYMAPEQFLRRPLDGRTDLYSLGCVYYQSLAGRRPFQATSVAGVMDLHLKHQVVLLHDWRPDLPTKLCDWVMWLINADPAARPANAQVALDSLRVLASEGLFANSAVVPARTATSGVAPSVGGSIASRSAGAPRPARTTSSNVPTRTTGSQPTRATGAFVPQRPAAPAPHYAASAAPAPGRPTAPLVRPTTGPLPASAAKKAMSWIMAILVVGLAAGAALYWMKHEASKRGGGASPTQAENPNVPPPQPAGLFADDILRFRAGIASVAWHDAEQKARDPKPGDLVLECRNQSAKFKTAALVTRDRKKDHCPKYVFSQPDGFRVKCGFLQFDFGDAMSHRIDPNHEDAAYYPFGEALKEKGVTVYLLVKPRLADKDTRLFSIRNQDGRAELVVRAYPANEFRCQARVRAGDGKESIAEGKITGRSVKGYSVVTVTWNGPNGKITMSVRSQDGGKARTEFNGPKNSPSLTELRIGEPANAKNPPPVTEQFAGDIAELVVWPFHMDWEPRSELDQKLAEFYFATPGTRFNN